MISKDQIDQLVAALVPRIAKHFVRGPQRFAKHSKVSGLDARLKKIETRLAGEEGKRIAHSARKFAKAERAAGRSVNVIDEISRRIRFQKRQAAATNKSELASAQAREAVERSRAAGKTVVFKDAYNEALSKLQ